MNFYKYNPLKADSWLPIPKEIENKNATLNIVNLHDNECFKWCILAKLHNKETNANRINQYKEYENELNFDGIEFPLSPSQLSKFEAQNSHVSVNVYILVKKSRKFSVTPLYLTSGKKATHVHLLLVQSSYDDEDGSVCEGKLESVCKENEAIPELKNVNITNKNRKRKLETNVKITKKSRMEEKGFHYALIKDLSKLLSKQLSKKRTAKHICDRCLQYFGKKRLLEKHEEYCANMNDCKIRMPEKVPRLYSKMIKTE